MTNTVNIPERTLAQIGLSADSINVIGGVGGRLSAYQPLVVRITDHQDNDAGEVGADTDKMAIFMSKQHGQPWEKEANVLEHVIHDGPTTGGAVPANASMIYVDFDYSTFE
jgi:hypothetical protein